jgi:hypothetical protein
MKPTKPYRTKFDRDCGRADRIDGRLVTCSKGHRHAGEHSACVHRVGAVVIVRWGGQTWGRA